MSQPFVTCLICTGQHNDVTQKAVMSHRQALTQLVKKCFSKMALVCIASKVTRGWGRG